MAIVVIFGVLLHFFGPSLAELLIDPTDPNRESILAISTYVWFDYLVFFYFLHAIVSVLLGCARDVGYTASTSIISLVCEGGLKLA